MRKFEPGESVTATIHDNAVGKTFKVTGTVREYYSAEGEQILIHDGRREHLVWTHLVARSTLSDREAAKTTERWIASVEGAGKQALFSYNAGHFGNALSSLNKVEHYAEQARQLIVDEMRLHGASWAEVGKIFDVSRQAAQQRFGR